ncbi:BZ3500_MvSof-1268-A1-R1_Chr2-2g04773 [Microbotryum saponariae]|uniref:BZ3500_MvSof-1268-A1-R1_Chr2-2g04773 protein n=1 Tax=Microbotryum saponariae TaxID=289078 RepID=A0A2X0LM80_9BASI|nr:BZ3500_MvSof-1268-A1-R1_Chr2-2g04773 [Microbotryum saponariae]SDA00133.1 BZ3501_MvSof-1269-A2-R1_Chr2-2g04447 [Microbotryum saponariae]
MGGGPMGPDWSIGEDDSVDDRSSGDAIEVTTTKRNGMAHSSHPLASGQDDGMTSVAAEYGAASVASPHNDGDDQVDAMATLLWSKSKVYLHPSTYHRDNIPGFISIVRHGTDYLLAWIPEASVVGTSDFEAYVLVELNAPPSATEATILVTAPAPSSAHAFSIPIRRLYSLLVQAPTLTSWYGSVTCSLFGGETLPPLWFHDEESRSTVVDRDQRVAALGALGSAATSHRANPDVPIPPSWGGEALLSQLRKYAHVLRSQVEPSLFLINPAREDIEVHSTPLFEDDEVPSEAMQGLRLHNNASSSSNTGFARRMRENKRNSILHQSLDLNAAAATPSSGNEWPDEVPAVDNLTFSVLNSFSRITRGARSGIQVAAQSVLSHPLAKPLAKHIPEPIAHFANAPGELTRLQESAGVGAYDAARVYLAKWARVVAEEGERARRAEVIVNGSTDEASEVGAFEILSSVYKVTRPRSSRASATPILVTEWASWFDDQGRLMLDEYEAKKRIFQRGLAEDARKDVWPFLLKVFSWTSTTEERKRSKQEKMEQYDRQRSNWADDTELKKSERWAEENHRVGGCSIFHEIPKSTPLWVLTHLSLAEIDCRRTDRTHPLFMSDEMDPSAVDPESPHPPSNEHVRRMQEILLTYVFADSSRDYVQGMSDLLSPLYVVCEGDPVLALGCFETVMERMRRNFMRDQVGMKSQLSQLQSLLRIMDPQLYTHLDQTGSLNLFFCFRWILCGFKRELSFTQTLQLWEILWTDHLGSNFHLFIALSIIEAHRDVVIRYLREFDEILKFMNELSGTLDIEAIINDAEVLHATFRQVVDACDRQKIEATQAAAEQHPSAEGLRKRGTASSSTAPSYPPVVEVESERFKVEVPALPEIDDSLRSLFD